MVRGRGLRKSKHLNILRRKKAAADAAGLLRVKSLGEGEEEIKCEEIWR